MMLCISLKINFQTVFCDFRSFTTAIWCKHQNSPGIPEFRDEIPERKLSLRESHGHIHDIKPGVIFNDNPAFAEQDISMGDIGHDCATNAAIW